jgi:hypothetical protein
MSLMRIRPYIHLLPRVVWRAYVAKWPRAGVFARTGCFGMLLLAGTLLSITH